MITSPDGYRAVSIEVRWPRGEGAPAVSIVENLGRVAAFDPDTGCALWVGGGVTGFASGAWTTEISVEFVHAQARLVVHVDELDADAEGSWSRLVRHLEARGVHQLTEKTETA